MSEGRIHFCISGNYRMLHTYSCLHENNTVFVQNNWSSLFSTKLLEIENNFSVRRCYGACYLFSIYINIYMYYIYIFYTQSVVVL